MTEEQRKWYLAGANDMEAGRLVTRPQGDQMVSGRVLLGDSVFEDATLVIRDGWLHIEFEADLDSVSFPLSLIANGEQDG